LKVLVTGGNGLLGSKISKVGRQKGYSIYPIDKSFNTKGSHLIEQDICDREGISRIIERIRPELIIHTAALTNVDKCEREKKLAWEINVEGTRNIVECSKLHGSFLIYISTDYVFSGDKGHYTEENDPNPINFYGETKLEGERIMEKELESWCIARSCVIYGCNPAAGKTNFALWALDNLENGKMISVITDQLVSPTLNTNLAEMILEVADKRLEGIYHLAGATAISRFDFVLQLATVLGLDPGLIRQAKSKDMNWKAKRPKNSSLDISKASNTLQNKPLALDQSLSLLKSELER
jgi:dTDP-4-dehydrorhamnose reductase